MLILLGKFPRIYSRILFLSTTVFSYKHLKQWRITYIYSTLYTIQHFVLFDILSFDVLSHSTFWHSTFCLIRCYFYSTFCPIQRFVPFDIFYVWYFVRSTFWLIWYFVRLTFCIIRHFGIRHFVPFDVLSFDVLSIRRLLLRHFVGEPLRHSKPNAIKVSTHYCSEKKVNEYINGFKRLKFFTVVPWLLGETHHSRAKEAYSRALDSIW
jgi:hypothetical protein